MLGNISYLLYIPFLCTLLYMKMCYYGSMLEIVPFYEGSFTTYTGGYTTYTVVTLRIE